MQSKHRATRRTLAVFRMSDIAQCVGELPEPDHSHTLIPKQHWLPDAQICATGEDDSPCTLPGDHPLFWLTDELGPAERRAMRDIIQNADLVEDGHQTYIVAAVMDETIDALAAFEAEGEGREMDHDYEPGEDREPEDYSH